MSVAVYSNEELRGLWRALVDIGAPETESAVALTAIGLANRAAYAMTYQDETSIEFPRFTQDGVEEYRPVPEWTPEQWTRNLLYNCVTNAGTDFAPASYAEQLLRWSRPIPIDKSAAREALLESIRPGTKVTILVPAGIGRNGVEYKPRTGRAVMHGSYGWVLNMGGAHGTPAVATAENIVKIQNGRNVCRVR